MKRLVILFAIVYAMLCIGIWLIQRSLLFFPTGMTPEQAAAEAAHRGFLPWTNAIGQVIGWKLPASGVSTGSVLIVHGNAGWAGQRDYLAAPIHEAAAVDVFVLEYPGYGARAGSPSKAAFDTAAEEAFQLLPANLPRYVVSESLGAGVAAGLAQRHPQAIAGLALLVPYDNLAAVAQRRMWMFPSYFLLRDRFHPAANLKHYHGPVMFVIAGDDEILGPETGLRLAAGYAGPKDVQVIPGARHNDVSARPAQWWRETFAFWEKNHWK